jgi:hypothetical protein
VDFSLYFISLGLVALGFLKDYLNFLGIGLYLKKNKDIRFVRNTRRDEAYTCWKERRRDTSCLE